MLAVNPKIGGLSKRTVQRLEEENQEDTNERNKLLQDIQNTSSNMLYDMIFFRPDVELAMDMYSIPSNPHRYFLVYEVSSQNVCGCSANFPALTGYDVKTLQNNFSYKNFVPERIAEPYHFMVQWIFASDIKRWRAASFFGINYGKEIAIKTTVHFQRNYLWLDFCLTEYFDDEYLIEDTLLPAMLRVKSEDIVGKDFTPPAESFKRVLDFLCSFERKAVYSDQLARQETVIQEMRRNFIEMNREALERAEQNSSPVLIEELENVPEVQNSMPTSSLSQFFQPISLSNQEISQVMNRYQCATSDFVNH